MYRRLYRTTRQLLSHWRKRPLAAMLLLMVAFTATAGPAVCVLDCWLHALRAAQHDPHSLHQHYAVVDTEHDTSGTRHEQHHSNGNGDAPSALTIAVVLLLVLLLPLSWARRRPFEAGRFPGSLAIPPPPRPPRYSPSCVYTAA